MPSEMADDPKRPRPDEDDADDESAEDDDDAARRERDERTFKDDLEIADEFEPTLDVPLPISDTRAPERDLAQAIILAAASLLKMHLGDDRSARSLCARAVALLLRVPPATARAHGIDVVRLVADLERALRGGSWPHLRPIS